MYDNGVEDVFIRPKSRIKGRSRGKQSPRAVCVFFACLSPQMPREQRQTTATMAAVFKVKACGGRVDQRSVAKHGRPSTQPPHNSSAFISSPRTNRQ